MDGFAFRLLLSTEREVEVRKKLFGEAAAAKQAPGLNLALRSWHHGAMAMLDGQHPAFATTARCGAVRCGGATSVFLGLAGLLSARRCSRLAKRWVVGMMAEGDVAEEAVELLVAQCFCGAGALPPPGTHVAGFARFLHLIASHAWAHVPLIVDPHNEITAEQSSKIHSIFEVARFEALGFKP